MPHGVICHSDALQEYENVANGIPVFELMEYSICCEIMILKFQLRQDNFVCIICQMLQN